MVDNMIVINDMKLTHATVLICENGEFLYPGINILYSLYFYNYYYEKSVYRFWNRNNVQILSI